MAAINSVVGYVECIVLDGYPVECIVLDAYAVECTVLDAYPVECIVLDMYNPVVLVKLVLVECMSIIDNGHSVANFL